ncbi:MAG: helix-turn-helix domain-containing protein [Alphaproteobacteria bacterium]|nr:helix-turn-helix domain-containing protein [Alphaproteobacteria bacterium]
MLASVTARSEVAKETKCATPVICDGLDLGEVDRLVSMARQRELRAKATLFFEMDPAKHVYEVTAGILKLYRLTSDGRRQITGFVYPGQFLGLTQAGCHVATAEAVTPVTVWCYPRERLEALIDEMPSLARRLLQLANDELLSAQNQILWLGRKNTLERVGAFLLQLAERVRAGGGDPRQLHLPMSRTDIADYLGLTVETVSRTFTRLRKMGAISLGDSGRHVECDLDWLRRLTDAEDGPTVH